MSALAVKTEASRNRRYTYADYYSWGENAERCELIDGVIYAMSAPTVAHQHIAGNLFVELYIFFKGKRCRPFISPIDVRLNPKGLDDTVVQPDIVVICDPEKIREGKACVGAPDLVIEVLSPGTTKRDRRIKFLKYEQAGVREYWIVDPGNKTVETYVLENQKLVPHDFADMDEKIKSHIFDGLEIDLTEIFAEIFEGNFEGNFEEEASEIAEAE
ncbi:MAG: Uma2 family endonuclease [Defluviitaleaceae bacterium]|nr:Uma2 family endonuclease [Defluviitaleaceae bacterium]